MVHGQIVKKISPLTCLLPWLQGSCHPEYIINVSIIILLDLNNKEMVPFILKKEKKKKEKREEEMALKKIYFPIIRRELAQMSE